MRVTLTIHSLAAGGAERVLAGLANSLARRGWEINLITLAGASAEVFYPLDPAVTHQPLNLSGKSRNPIAAVWNNLIRIARLRKAIVATRPDAVVSFMDSTNVITILATRGLAVPVVVSERSAPTVFSSGPAWKALRWFVYPLADCVVCQTESARQAFPRRVQRRARVIPNPVAVPRDFAATRVSERRAAGDTRRVLIGMGRLGKEKGFDLLINAFAGIASEHPDWLLEIWGEGEERRELTELINRLGMASRIRLPGRTGTPFDIMAKADMFVLSSRFEGFPNVLCEAMACGLPVIAFDCPSGPRHIVRHEVDGVLVPAEDVGALAGAMKRLMSDAGARRRLSARAPEVCDRFGVERVMGLWCELLEQLINQRRHPSQPGGAQR